MGVRYERGYAMGAGPIVECAFCLQRMSSAEGWMVWLRPNGGATEFLCPSCRERPDVQATQPDRPLAEWTLDMAAPCACGHARSEHDAVASRFCAATASAGLARACACPVAQAAPPRHYDRR